MKKSELKPILRRLILAGQTDEIVLLGAEPWSDVDVNKLKKAARAFDKGDVHNDVLFASSKQYFDGIASWDHSAAVVCQNGIFRWRILNFDYHGIRYCYGIPAQMNLPPAALPGVNLSRDELALLFRNANKISSFPDLQDCVINLPHPQRDVICEEAAKWKLAEFDREAATRLLRDSVIFKSFEAALDIQMRAFLANPTLPCHLWHFLGGRKDSDFPGSLIGAIDAVTFTTDTQKAFSGPLYLNLKDDSNSVKRQIASFSGQMVVLFSNDYALKRELAENLIQVELQQHAGYITASQLKSPIIVLSQKAFLSPVIEAVDITHGWTGISIDDQRQLRAVTARLLTKNFAYSVFSDWKQWMTSPDAFGIDRRRCWLLCLESNLVDSLAELGIDIKGIADTARVKAEERLRQHQVVLDTVLTAMEHLNNVSGIFCERPETKSEAEDILGKYFYCFRHTPSRGDDRGVDFILFTKESLCRFWKQFGCDEQLFDQALQHTKSDGILAKPSHQLTLGDESMRFVWFYAEKCGF